jgi:hypothetical protein
VVIGKARLVARAVRIDATVVEAEEGRHFHG